VRSTGGPAALKPRRGTRAVVQTQDLLRLDRERLAALLAQQLATLPHHRQRAWAAQHLAPSAASRSATPSKLAGLLREIEAFCATSRDGKYVSWVDDDGWQGGDDEDGEEFHEWTTLFADLTRSALALTHSAQHSAAVSAYRMLLGLLREAGQTTDILGNHGAPEDAIDLDLGRVIEAYARSLLATRPPGGVDAVLDELRPVAKQHRYAGGLVGLARALDAEGRARLRARLTGSADAGSRPGESSSSDAAEGLIALATVERKPAEVLALKERFASGNAIYLKEVLEHYQRKAERPVHAPDSLVVGEDQQDTPVEQRQLERAALVSHVQLLVLDRLPRVRLAPFTGKLLKAFTLDRVDDDGRQGLIAERRARDRGRIRHAIQHRARVRHLHDAAGHARRHGAILRPGRPPSLRRLVPGRPLPLVEDPVVTTRRALPRDLSGTDLDHCPNPPGTGAPARAPPAPDGRLPQLPGGLTRQG